MLVLTWIVAGTAIATTPLVAPHSFRSGDLRAIRLLPVQHEGRWSPLDTVARDMVSQVTGTSRWAGRDPVVTLLDWTFRPDDCRGRRLIRVRSAEVRRLIGLPLDRDRFSLKFLQQHDGLNDRLTAAMQKRRERIKLDALDAKVEDIVGRISILTDVLSDRVIRPVPDPNDARGRWLSISEGARLGGQSYESVRQRWHAVGQAFVSGDGPELASAAARLTDALGQLDAAYRPDAKLIELELWYNRLDPFGRSWALAVVAATLALVAMIVRRRWTDVATWVVAAAAFALVTYGVGMRWRLAGRIPAANMYESVIFMGWGLCLATMICLGVVRNRLVTFVASLLAAVSLLLADVLSLDPFIRPVAPVLLDTAWMAIHVPVIMVSYSVLMISMGFGLTILCLGAAAPGRGDLIAATDHLHHRFIQVGVILLTAGIVTGSMWGSASWGRYWGWDPKEVWSLIALLGYVAILHARATGWIRVFGTALCSTLAFWLIVMAYLGVNYVLGIGLHSYAFGKGSVVRWLLIFGCVQLALTGGVVAVYVTRRTGAPGNGRVARSSEGAARSTEGVARSSEAEGLG